MIGKIILTFALVGLVLGGSSPCNPFLDYPDLANADQGFWNTLDGILINIPVLGQNDSEVTQIVQERLLPYVTDDFLFVIYDINKLSAPMFVVNGSANVAGAVLLQSRILGNWGERHLSNGLGELKCVDSNTYEATKGDLSFARTARGMTMVVGQKFTTFSRTSPADPFLLKKIILTTQGRLYLTDSTGVVPYGEQPFESPM